MSEQELLNQIITLLWRRDWRTASNRAEIASLLHDLQGRIIKRAKPKRVSRMDVLSLSEAARCLGVAQAKNDVDAMEHWKAESLRLESAICAKAEPEKVESEGWKLVPVEPTEEMLAAGGNAVLRRFYFGPEGPGEDEVKDAKAAYSAMLAAAPQLQEQK